MINISRRGFLGGLLASGASALIGPSLLGRAVMAAESGDKLVQSGSHWGAFRARVVDGRWVETRRRGEHVIGPEVGSGRDP